MKLLIKLVFIVLVFILSTEILKAEDDKVKINGEVYEINDDGSIKKLNLINFSIINRSDITISNPIVTQGGVFSEETNNFKPGEEIRFEFPSPWKVMEPKDGKYIIRKNNSDNNVKLVIFKSFEYKYIQNNNKKIKKVYAVQVLTTTMRGKALETRNSLIKKMGHSNSFITVERASNNTVYYYVYVGNYPTEKRAKEISTSFYKKFKEYGFPLVKIFED